MKSVDAPTLSARLDRFIRWFVSASPEAEVDPWLPVAAEPRSPTVAQRQPARLRPQHSGPVRVAAKGKP